MTSIENDISFLELSTYNNTGAEEYASLSYQSGKILDDDSYWRIMVQKFYLDTMNFPVFVPTIIKEWKPMQPIITNSTTDLLDQPDNSYITDWCISIVFNDSTAVNIKTISTCVSWTNPNYKYSNSFDTTERAVINNKYFWALNSYLLLKNVNDAINQIITAYSNLNIHSIEPGDIALVKNGEVYSFIVRSYPDLSFKILVNENMKKCFNFYYEFNNFNKNVQEVILNFQQTTTINNIDFFISSTISPNTRLFPFIQLVFKSSDIGIDPIHIENSTTLGIKAKDNIILSYDLIINDIDQIGNIISYANNNPSRYSTMTKVFSNFKIELVLVSNKGYTFNLQIDVNDSINLTLKFF